MILAFKGKPPGSGSGEMSKRTEALRPVIELTPAQAAKARKLRRQGHEPGQIALHMGVPLEEIEKALVQMRSPRPETTRGTLNVTLAAHTLILSETHADEPVWQSFDRIIDELVTLRSREKSLAVKLREMGELQEGESVWSSIDRILAGRSGARGAASSRPRMTRDRPKQPAAVSSPSQMALGLI